MTNMSIRRAHAQRSNNLRPRLFGGPVAPAYNGDAGSGGDTGNVPAQDAAAAAAADRKPSPTPTDPAGTGADADADSPQGGKRLIFGADPSTPTNSSSTGGAGKGSGAKDDDGGYPDVDLPPASGGTGAGSGTDNGAHPLPNNGSSPGGNGSGNVTSPLPGPTNTSVPANNVTTAHPTSTPLPAAAATSTSTSSSSKPKAEVTAAPAATAAPTASAYTPPSIITQIITSQEPAPVFNGTTVAGSGAGEDNSQAGVIIGAIAGGIAGVIILIWLILIPVRRRQARQKDVDWALAFGNDHGPSDNSADAVFGAAGGNTRRTSLDDIHHRGGGAATEKTELYANPAEFAGAGGAPAFGATYGADGQSASQQWLAPGAVVSGQQGYPSGTPAYQEYAYFNTGGANPKPDGYASPGGSPNQSPAAYYGWSTTQGAPGAVTSPPTPMGTPLFTPSVSRGFSTSTKQPGATTASPASGPVVYMGHPQQQQQHQQHGGANTYPPVQMSQELDRGYAGAPGANGRSTPGGVEEVGAAGAGLPGYGEHYSQQQHAGSKADGDDVYGGLSHDEAY